MVVVPLQPPVLVPWNVSVFPTMPPSTPPVKVMFPEPLTAPVMVCVIAVVGVAVAALFRVMATLLEDPSESVLEPVLIVYAVVPKLSPPTVIFPVNVAVPAVP